KVLSGDSVRTVAAVAAQLGMPHADRTCDARELPEDLPALGQALEERSVFGRVTPHQKQAMVRALQARGHTVAMTGDGVNDALAAFGLARANDLPLVQQRTGATIVTLIASLTVLVILARPLTLRRALLVASMIAAFLLLFPIAWVRDFYAFTLPRDVLGGTLL